MEDDSARQQEEIDALKAIYQDDFIEDTAKKAWKGAAALREFTLRVCHPAPHLAASFQLHFHISLPKTYPSRALPTIRPAKNVKGVPSRDVERLIRAMRAEMQALKGNELLFHAMTFCQEWMVAEYPESRYPPAMASLAAEMTTRESREHNVKELQREDQFRAQRQHEAELAAQMEQEVKHTAERKQAKQRLEMHSRTREKTPPPPGTPDFDSLSLEGKESFDEPISILGLPPFSTVVLERPRQVSLGVAYSAYPAESESLSIPLQLLVITFKAPHYYGIQGSSKIERLFQNISKLKRLQHPNLQTVYACKLYPKSGRHAPRLVILMESEPTITLWELLHTCGILAPSKAAGYLCQILLGLSALHEQSLLHRCLTSQHIGLYRPRDGEGPLIMKLTGSSYHAEAAGLNRSNPFGIKANHEPPWPESWLSPEMVRSPLVFNLSRDVYHLALVALEMHGGVGVSQDYDSPYTALSIVPNFLHAPLRSMLDYDAFINCKAIAQSISQPANIPDPIVMARHNLEDDAWPRPSVVPQAVNMKEQTPARSMIPPHARQGSRYRSDWDELEFLGSGGFGEVVKARNKLDGRIYAVKKIRLRPSDNDAKIFREVTALAKLSHRSIVRYMTTWIEISEEDDAPSASDSESNLTDGSDKDHTIRTSSRNDDIFQLDLDDLTRNVTHQDSFPGIYFADSTGVEDARSDEDDDELTNESQSTRSRSRIPASTLYIQMEYVENRTLKERVAAGLDEDEAWRLFHQLLDALPDTPQLHRDIKLGNIFIDASGDCKIGDFGLAISDLALVDSNASSQIIRPSNSDITLDVGTMLYVAPEMLARTSKRGQKKNHSKADMYSLGIVFFEMNFTFTTSAERVSVIEKLRADENEFPSSWEAHRLKQRKKVITLLLQHDVNMRPTALQLSQSPLLPPRVGDEPLRQALQAISKPDSPHYADVMQTIFNQTPHFARTILFDDDMITKEHLGLSDIVEKHMKVLFCGHGAVAAEPPLLLPATRMAKDDPQSVFLLDSHGDMVTLPRNAVVSFARLAAKSNVRRIKRFHIGSVYQARMGGGHPSAVKAAVFDIITPSVKDGVSAAIAECMCLIGRVVDRFPGLDSSSYEIRVFHPSITDYLASRFGKPTWSEIVEILSGPKPFGQKRVLLMAHGLSKAIVDEIEILTTPVGSLDELDHIVSRVQEPVYKAVLVAVDAIKEAVLLGAPLTGKRVTFQLLNIHQTLFKDSVAFEVTKGSRRSDVLAACGRYDHLFEELSITRVDRDALRSVALQIAIDKITASLAKFQNDSVRRLIKEQRSFGFWSPRRCDVYIISHQVGQLQERLKLASILWSHNISTDVMYDSGLEDGPEVLHDHCVKEGILFTVFPRPNVNRAQPNSIKVISTLTRSEHEVTKGELISFLQQRLAEQAKTDSIASGGGTVSGLDNAGPSKEMAAAAGLQLLLPPERKQSRHNKKIIFDKASQLAEQVQHSAQSGMPSVAVQVPSAAFNAMTVSVTWLLSDDSECLKPVAAAFPSYDYLMQIREAILKFKHEGKRFVLLISVRDDRVYLLDLNHKLQS